MPFVYFSGSKVPTDDSVRILAPARSRFIQLFGCCRHLNIDIIEKHSRSQLRRFLSHTTNEFQTVAARSGLHDKSRKMFLNTQHPRDIVVKKYVVAKFRKTNFSCNTTDAGSETLLFHIGELFSERNRHLVPVLFGMESFAVSEWCTPCTVGTPRLRLLLRSG